MNNKQQTGVEFNIEHNGEVVLTKETLRSILSTFPEDRLVITSGGLIVVLVRHSNTWSIEEQSDDGDAQ